MGNEVYANGREVACKAADGKSICAFPDVCFTPPQTPVTPPGVPIPYPNTGLASDTTDGSKSVKISGKEVMLKNKSYFKKSTGDEAGCAPKKGVITSKNTGKVFFNVWSMDVKIEGENAVRHLDLTTHNHASVPGDTPTWPYLDKMSVAKATGPCKDEIKKEKKACEGCKPDGDKDPCPEHNPPKQPEKYNKYVRSLKGKGLSKSETESLVNKEKVKPYYQEHKKDVEKYYDDLSKKNSNNECLKARRCMLQPYSPKRCCPGQTAHHLVEAGCFFDVGRGGDNSTPLAGSKYDTDKAPCICVEGPNNTMGTHGLMHSLQGYDAIQNQDENGILNLAKGKKTQTGTVTYGQSKESGVNAVKDVFPESECSEECLKAQLDAYHNKVGVDDSTNIRSNPSGRTSEEDVLAARQKIEKLKQEVVNKKSITKLKRK